MTQPIVYGPSFSTYVRTVRLVLVEKNVDYELVEVDMMSGQHKQPEHLARHPFGKVPTLQHDDVALYETVAITRYLDAAFPEVMLTPSEPRQIGFMAQAIAVVDAYAYPTLIGKVVVPRIVLPHLGQQPDEEAIAQALPMADQCLDAFDAMLENSVWLSGGDLGLADLHLAPVIAAFSAMPEGRDRVPARTNLARWWGAMSARESMALTEPRFG